MGLGWDSEAQTIVVELLAVSDTESSDASVVLDDAEEGPDAVRVSHPGVGTPVRHPFAPGHLRGPPPCPLCDEPLDPAGHLRAHQRIPAGGLSGADDDLDS